MKRAEKVAVVTFKNGDKVPYWYYGKNPNQDLESFKLIWTAKADPRGFACLTIWNRAKYEKNPYAGDPQVFGMRKMEVANAV